MEKNSQNAFHRLQDVRHRIQFACQRFQRNPAEVSLIAVSKTRPADSIRQLAGYDQNIFAENYVQEGVSKVHDLKELKLEWHFIGHLQSNKSNEVAQYFNWIHSIDRLKIAQTLNKAAQQHHQLNVLIQVKLDNEDNKAGVLPKDLANLVDRLGEFEHLKFRGLMSIPKPESTFEAQRQSFARVKDLAKNIEDRGISVDCLSMGMSNDMEAAIAEGATHIRIGTALFGPRNYATKN